MATTYRTPTELPQGMFLAGCAGKDKHDTAEAAEAVRRMLKRGKLGSRMPSKEADQLDAYECVFCGSWHLGH